MLTTLEFEMLTEYRCNCALLYKFENANATSIQIMVAKKRRYPDMDITWIWLENLERAMHVLCGGMQL